MFVGPQPLHFGLGDQIPVGDLWLRVLWPGQEGVDADGNWSNSWQFVKVPAVDQSITVSLSE